jgi:hypothetical protein
MVQKVEKGHKTGLTRLRKSRAVEARDPDVYNLGWRLRAMEQDLWALRTIANRNKHRWPKMEEELHQMSLTVLTYMARVQIAHDQVSADIT